MKKAMAVMMLLAGGLMAAPRVSVGIGFGVPAPVVAAPPCPGPGYTWVNGYYAPSGVWVAGYWAPPAVVTVAPRVFHAPAYERFGRVEHFRR
jgi:WXXGXW repeat (2 copies)